MRQLYRSELVTIVNHLQKKKITDEYAEQRNKWAFLAAVIANCSAMVARAFGGKKGRKPKTIEPDDFISKDFKKIIRQISGLHEGKPFENHADDAKQKGLKGPW